MADESILTYKKPGFPKVENTTSGKKTTIEYIGPESTLNAAEPARGAAWGEYAGTVVYTKTEPIPGTTYGELVVILDDPFDSDDGGGGAAGTEGEKTYEVEWEVFNRSLFEHPVFAKGQGGQFELSNEDIIQIQKWQNEEDTAQKNAYKFKQSEEGDYAELSTNAQRFVDGLLIGLEQYEDFYPIVRITTKYYGGLPPLSRAGTKDRPPNFTGQPSERYEWRKAADRAVRSDIETTWERVEEWHGAQKVLIDRFRIYY